ncbi:uncharacterized protein LOC143028928 [Oratosquilla oratoria]|uniref:uncharacterized protein LOC143028928 n=1 Tax=Oratosquilla oratoria TaxID=337810 RepID=UPI003F75F964
MEKWEEGMEAGGPSRRGSMLEVPSPSLLSTTTNSSTSSLLQQQESLCLEEERSPVVKEGPEGRVSEIVETEGDAAEAVKEPSDVSILVKEVLRCHRERQKLARTHRKLEVKVSQILARKKQDGESGEKEEEEGEGSGDDVWGEQLSTLRGVLQELDREAASQELRYRLLVEDAKSQADLANREATEIHKDLLDALRRIHRSGYSSHLPHLLSPKDLEDILSRQCQIEEQLTAARTQLLSQQLKENELRGALEKEKEAHKNKVSASQMTNLTVELRAYTEEELIQVENIEAAKKSLRRSQKRSVRQKMKLDFLQEQLVAEKDNLKELTQSLAEKKIELEKKRTAHARLRKKWETSRPPIHLLLDLAFPSDIKRLKHKVDIEARIKKLKDEERERARTTLVRGSSS